MKKTIKMPSSNDKFINGSQLLSEVSPEYLYNASDDKLMNMRIRAESAIAYYSSNGYPEMVRSLEVVVEDVVMEQQNRVYQQRMKEAEKASTKSKSAPNGKGSKKVNKVESESDDTLEFGEVNEPKFNEDDW